MSLGTSWSLRRGVHLGLVLGAVLLMAGCASTSHKAPVEDRGAGARAPGTQRPPASAAPAGQTAAPAGTQAATAATDAAAKPPPGIENAGKPGYYTVKPGDMLIRIALENGQNWRDVARWNSLDNPNRIEVGQVLRVVPPTVDAAAVVTQPVAQARVEARPLDANGKPAAATPGASAPTPASAASAAAPAASTATAAAPAAAATAPAAEADDAWIWPAKGPLLAGFDEGKNNGLAIGGKAGDPVVAVADGRVYYAGFLRGYGNLVIVKHNNGYISAYAHNQKLEVKDEQAVRRGQKIAEMGNSEAERVQLHFELRDTRKQGKPVDPAKLLPAR